MGGAEDSASGGADKDPGGEPSGTKAKGREDIIERERGEAEVAGAVETGTVAESTRMVRRVRSDGKFFRWACRKLCFSPEVDAFARKGNRKCPRWYGTGSPEGNDSFKRSWGRDRIWMNPPFSRMSEVVDRIRTEEMHGMVVVPDWEWSRWHKRLMQMTQRSLVIPKGTRFFELPDRDVRGVLWDVRICLVCGHGPKCVVTGPRCEVWKDRRRPVRFNEARNEVRVIEGIVSRPRVGQEVSNEIRHPEPPMSRLVTLQEMETIRNRAAEKGVKWGALLPDICAWAGTRVCQCRKVGLHLCPESREAARRVFRCVASVELEGLLELGGRMQLVAPLEKGLEGMGKGGVVREAGTSNTETALFVQKLSDRAVLPQRATDGAAGYDLSSARDVMVTAGGHVLVPTDLAIMTPKGTYGRVAPRSGLALKHGIAVGAGVVDADYRGSVGVVLFNHGRKDFEVHAGDRVAQLILEQISLPEVVEVHTLPPTQRGAGGFGSSGMTPPRPEPNEAGSRICKPSKPERGVQQPN